MENKSIKLPSLFDYKFDAKKLNSVIGMYDFVHTYGLAKERFKCYACLEWKTDEVGDFLVVKYESKSKPKFRYAQYAICKQCFDRLSALEAAEQLRIKGEIHLNVQCNLGTYDCIGLKETSVWGNKI